MDLDAFAALFFSITVPMSIFVVVMVALGFWARAAVPGSRQRWVLGGIYRAGLVLGATHSACGLLMGLVQQQAALALLSGPILVLYVYLYRQWSKYSDDDDFWNSMGRGIKKMARRAKAAVSVSGRHPAPAAR